MTETQNVKPKDLEEKTLKFAREVCEFVSVAPKTPVNVEILKQLVRSAGPVGANYIEANESVSKKDYIFRVKLCRKEVKESRYWLDLLQLEKDEMQKTRRIFANETNELMRIFGAIIEKTKEQ